ncbi:MAG: histidinol-phosphate transaminase [uncultured bacterium]|nr:MAG: histidinol-phosphate transaminase [uncultured bacterium]
MSKTNFANPIVQAMNSYAPPAAERRAEFKGTLLDFNERSTALPEVVVSEIMAQLKKLPWQVYPEDCSRAQMTLAQYCGVQSNQLLLTNGSDQAIDIIFRTFTQPRATVIIPKPSFSMFWQATDLLEQRVLSPQYREDLSFPLSEVLALADEKPQLVVLCTPNNPTGTSLTVAEIEKIVQTFPDSLIYIDEAYADFSGMTAVTLLANYPNIIISRTFSKAFGLASLRIGYILASAEHIQELNKVRKPYDVNAVAYLAVAAALKYQNSVQAYIEEVMQRAKPLTEKFFTDKGVKFFPSAANFLLFKPGAASDVKNVAQKLEVAGFAVRPRSGAPIDGTIRLTIGTVEQMQRFTETYTKLFL